MDESSENGKKLQVRPLLKHQSFSGAFMDKNDCLLLRAHAAITSLGSFEGNRSMSLQMLSGQRLWL